MDFVLGSCSALNSTHLPNASGPRPALGSDQSDVATSVQNVPLQGVAEPSTDRRWSGGSSCSQR